jgi:uncharacterized protein (DUF779 family)
MRCLHAQILVAFAAKLALPACPVHPRHPDAVSRLYALDGRAALHYPAHDFMPQDQRLLYDARQLLPVAVGHVQIGMAHTANLYLDQDIIRPGCGGGTSSSDSGVLNSCRTAAFIAFSP